MELVSSLLCSLTSFSNRGLDSLKVGYRPCTKRWSLSQIRFHMKMPTNSNDNQKILDELFEA